MFEVKADKNDVNAIKGIGKDIRKLGQNKYSTHWQDQYFEMKDKVSKGVYGQVETYSKINRAKS